MNKEEIISSGLLELYATGISSPEESQLVEQYLIQFPELKQELNNIEISLEAYAQANALQPSATVKQKVLSRVSPREEETKVIPVFSINKKTSSVSIYKLIAAALFILLIGSITLSYHFYHQYNSASSELQIALERVAQQQLSNKAMSEDLDIVTNKYAEPVVLKGTPRAPDAVAKIFWLRNTGEVYINPTNLPKAPAGKQYQLWGIVDGKPVDGGMITTEKGVYHIQKMKSFGKAEAFAITLEKAGGSPTPTMDEMVVISKM